MNGGGPVPVTIGVDVGGTKVLGVALDHEGKVLGEARAPTPAGGHGPGMHAVLATIADVVDRLAAAAELTAAGSAGGVDNAGGHGGFPLGAGVPGLVDSEGRLLFAPNLPRAEGVDFAGGLAGLGGVSRVVVDNDATCAMVGEWRYGSAAGVANAVMVTLGTGIGGGLVVNGKVVHGAKGFAGEVGHMVIFPDGRACSCGQRGCWECYASGTGLGRLAEEALDGGRLDGVLALAGGVRSAVRPEHVTQAAAEGDRGALEVLDELGWWIALGLSNLIAVLDPEVVVLGGGLMQAGDLVLAPTRRSLARLLEGGQRRPGVGLLPAALGELAGAVGAAVLARGTTRDMVVQGGAY
ncbi:MAG: ROK family protein [Acidimicrobiales bacterium]